MSTVAAGAAAIVPSVSALSSLIAKVGRQYERALGAQSIYFYPSKVTVLEQTSSPDAQSSATASSSQPHTAGDADANVKFTVRCVPALLDKAKEKHKAAKEEPNAGKASASTTDSSSQQNPHDVFAPPYHSDLLVEELPQHTVLLNKFCVVPKHFLLVTREFEPQTMPPSPEMLAIAYRILTAHKKGAETQGGAHEKEMLAFYNCGQVSGASQPHQHVQFAELGGQEDGNAAVPAEQLLDRIPSDGKEEDVFAFPLPYQHFVSLIKNAPIDDDASLPNYLGSKLLSLLDALFQARITQATSNIVSSNASSTSPPLKRAPPPSWNLLMTTRAMHLIPRQAEEFDGLRDLVRQEEKVHVEDGVDLVGAVSVNSLGYAGHLLVKSDTELEYLQKYPGGILEILRQTGVTPVSNVTTVAS